MPEDDVAEMYESAIRMLKDAGYRHYEISNWARPGYESVHNSRYWLAEDYIGCGVPRTRSSLSLSGEEMVEYVVA